MPIIEFAGFDGPGEWTCGDTGLLLDLGEGSVVPGDVFRPKIVTYTVALDTERNRHERRKADALRRRRREPPVTRVKLGK
jgi:hypothetical protein